MLKDTTFNLSKYEDTLEKKQKELRENGLMEKGFSYEEISRYFNITVAKTKNYLSEQERIAIFIQA